MKTCWKVLAVAVVALGVSLPAQATIINLTPSTADCGSPACLLEIGTTAANPESYLTAKYGTTLAYKQNWAGSEEGPAAGWYTTNQIAGGTSGSITWNGPGWVNGTPVYFLIKDGSTAPTWYFYDISNWGGKDAINFSDYWPGTGGISHASIFGGTTVPDGGSAAMLLGAALMGLAGFRRMLK